MKGSLHVATLLVGLVALSGCITSGYMPGRSDDYRRGRNNDYPVYARSGTGSNARYSVCHNGRNTLVVPRSAARAHINHGDYFGSCNQANRTRHDSWSRQRGNGNREAHRDHDDHRDDRRHDDRHRNRRGRGRH